MGIFSKIMFWKKGDNLGLGDELALPKGGYPRDELGLDIPGASRQPQFPQQDPPIGSFQDATMMRPQQFQQPQSYYSPNKDLELVSAKLDSLRATLENINQRIANLERVAYGEDDKRRGW